MAARDYETLYGVSLLDDLHNYFPAILYEPEQFRNVAQVLTYIQRQTHRRFDLFTFGQTAYNERRPQPPAPLAQRSVHPVAPPPLPASPTMPPLIPASSSTTVSTPVISVNLGAGSREANPHVYRYSSIPPVQIPRLSSLIQEAMGNAEEDEDTEEEETTEIRQVAEILTSGGRIVNNSQAQNQNTLTLLSALLGLRYPVQQTFPAEFLNPVIVRPTQEQIDAATTLTTLDNNSTENCAICQDNIAAQSEQREITHCHHAFHRGCIDTWFEQNVHCPVCRHDIRERSE